MKLDPFAFWPDAPSRITGLGGSGTAVDPASVFHTLYRTLPPGLCCFEIAAERLDLGGATLTLRVNALAPQPGEEAQTVATRQFTASRPGNAIFTIDFESEPGLSYAVLGSIEGDAPVTADALAVVARLTPSDGRAALAAARASFLASAAPDLIAGLVAAGPPTLANPVSQMCTASQFDEPVYAEWAAALHTAPRRHRKQWEFIYILQSLAAVGALTAGSRGLGFGVGLEPLPALMAARGCRIVATDLPRADRRAYEWHATDQHVAAVEQLFRPELCDADVFAERVTFRAVDMTKIPRDLSHFDFTWSSCAFEHLGSIAAGLAFVEASVECLRPGGVAVHTTEFNLSSNIRTLDNAGTVLFRRRDFEALASRLVRAGHTVMPLCYDFGDTQYDDHIDVAPYSAEPHLKLMLGGYISTSFGLIVRRGDPNAARRGWFGR